MKKIFLVLSILLAAFTSVWAQDMPGSVDEVIKWNFDVEYGECNDARIVITVDQKDGWHIYAQKQPEGGISAPTELIFKKSSSYKLVGSAKEYGVTSHGGAFPEKVFDGDKAIFKQKIKILDKKDFKLKLEYGFMACKEACFPPTWYDADISIKGSDCVEGEGEEEVKDPALVESVTSKIGFQSYAVKKSDTEYELRIKPIVADEWKLTTDGSVNPLKIKFDGEFKAKEGLQSAKFENGVYVDSAFSQLIAIDLKDSSQVITGSLLFSGLDSEGKSFDSEELSFDISLKIMEVLSLYFLHLDNLV